MGSLSARVTARLTTGLKKFQPILDSARKRDINESDTVTIVTDLLTEVLGYERYAEVTSEHSIRGTFCDIALKVDGDLVALLEAKAIGLELKESHVKQAVDYAANQGCDWVVLTNGAVWRIYKITFAKPIQADMVLELNLLELSHRKARDIELLGLLSREAWKKEHLAAHARQKEVLSRFTIAAVIQSEPVVQVIRRELRRLSKGMPVDRETVRHLIAQEVLKRDAIEGERAEAARRLVTRTMKRAARPAEKAEPAAPAVTAAPQAPVVA